MSFLDVGGLKPQAACGMPIKGVNRSTFMPFTVTDWNPRQQTCRGFPERHNTIEFSTLVAPIDLQPTSHARPRVSRVNFVAAEMVAERNGCPLVEQNLQEAERA
jgi:hypothetical protein